MLVEDNTNPRNFYSKEARQAAVILLCVGAIISGAVGYFFGFICAILVFIALNLAAVLIILADILGILEGFLHNYSLGVYLAKSYGEEILKETKEVRETFADLERNP